jgi:predicted small metal-binding protein
VTERIECAELGIEDCNFVASGETDGDVVREVVKHLRTEHDIDMPDADTIMAGELKEEPLEMVDPDVKIIVERLTEALDIVPTEEPEAPKPSIGRTSSR